MAAGLGFKTFTTGEVVTASDVNGYLMQGVLVFASEAARDAAITLPQEGQFAYTKDNNSLWYYTGSAWASSGATGDIEGVTAGVGISGGGTSGTVTITNSMATAIDAKGDLVAGTGADTFSRLAVGSNNQVLTADSTAATGLKWAAPAAGGGMTLISTATPSGATGVTFSSIPQSYKQLFVVWQGVTFSSPDTVFWVRLNGDTGSNYQTLGVRFNAGSPTAMGPGGDPQFSPVMFYADSGSDSRNSNGTFTIYRADQAQKHFCQWQNTSASSGGAGQVVIGQGIHTVDTDYVSQITFVRSSTQTITGTFYLYGEN
jgi:hypothetical protein